MAAKTGRKLVPARNKKKIWSKEDEMYLEDSWGVKSIKTIAKNLGRSENAVICRARKLGCGAFLEAGDYITLNQVLTALYGEGCTSYARTRLVERFGMPVKTKVVRRCRFQVINIDDFWDWAEKKKKRSGLFKDGTPVLRRRTGMGESKARQRQAAFMERGTAQYGMDS